ncbi:MAG: YecA family protein [Planctomycetota bacterium]
MTTADQAPANAPHRSLRAILRALAVFVLVLVPTAVAYWLLLREAHHATILEFVCEIFYRIDQQLGLVLVPAGKTEPILGGVQRAHSVSITREALDVLLVGSVFLPALVLATPLRLPRRLGALLLAAVVLLVAQIVQVTLASYAAYQTLIGRDSTLVAFVQTTCNYAGLLLPLPIWYGFAVRPLLRARREAGARPAAPIRAAAPTANASNAATPRHAATAPRNAPCPCGSGRKFKKCCGAA